MPSASKVPRAGRAGKNVGSVKLAAEGMRAIHGRDIFAEFTPVPERDVQGCNDQHQTMTQLVEELRHKVVVYLRVHKGPSSIFLARKLKESGIDGFVVAVDTFLSMPEQWKIAEDAPELPFAHSRPMLNERFLTNLIAEGVKDGVIPLRQLPVDAMRHL
jgi:hypothetical protein